MKKERIGIFGGTFDPPHLGHLILACEVRAQLQLDRLLWILTPDPPHKQGRKISPLAHRQKMVELAIEDNSNFELSLVEAERAGPHYSVDTVNILRGIYKNAAFIFLMGGDSLQELAAWHRPNDFVAACDEIGVMRRPEHQFDLAALARKIEGLAEKVRFVRAPLLEIASCEIRQRVRDGLSYRYYLAPGVYEYIQREKLYLNVET